MYNLKCITQFFFKLIFQYGVSLAEADNIKTFTKVINIVTKKVYLFHHSLTFTAKSRNIPLGRASTQRGSSHDCKYKARVKLSIDTLV